jgi:hypothetical protein
MKAYVSDNGDWSVGIPPNQMTLEVNHGYEMDKEFREQLREEIRQFAMKYFDFCPDWPNRKETRVLFGDECGECGSLIPDELNCPNRNCRSSPYNDLYYDLQDQSDIAIIYNEIEKTWRVTKRGADGRDIYNLATDLKTRREADDLARKFIDKYGKVVKSDRKKGRLHDKRNALARGETNIQIDSEMTCHDCGNKLTEIERKKHIDLCQSCYEKFLRWGLESEW